MQLSRQHYAYLRAIAEGVPQPDAAVRYLGVEHGNANFPAHRRVVEAARNIARRAGDARWRLIGVELPEVQSADAPPTLDAWAEAEGLGDWSHDELLALYSERFAVDQRDRRRRARNARLRERRLALIADLAAAATESALPTDSLAGWIPPDLAAQLRELGDLTVADLQARIARGGRWWAGLRAFGPTKAATLAARIAELAGVLEPWPLDEALQVIAALASAQPTRPNVADAKDDATAIEAWVGARASRSGATERAYRREAQRFQLWLALTAHRGFVTATSADCATYLLFLADVPSRWICRSPLKPLTPGWAPFKGGLTLASRRQAVTILHTLFAWLARSGYLPFNVWDLVSTRLPDDPKHDDDPTSRAFTPEMWEALQAQAAAEGATPSAVRLRWLCDFGEGTGLRADELLRAARQDFKVTSKGWLMSVTGKGSRTRKVPVPNRCMDATRRYFSARGLDFDTCPAATPLLAHTLKCEPIGYTSLNETFTRFVRRAAKRLAGEDMRTMQLASAHWLRHTFATRATERGMPLDVLQSNLGQSDPRTAAGYAKAQLVRRQVETEKAFAASDGEQAR